MAESAACVKSSITLLSIEGFALRRALIQFLILESVSGLCNSLSAGKTPLPLEIKEGSGYLVKGTVLRVLIRTEIILTARIKTVNTD